MPDADLASPGFSESIRPRVMGILNVTPDSFSDGGQFVALDAAVNQAKSMIEAGADIIDIGGESTRPGAEEVSAQQEVDRVVPVIEAIKALSDIEISIDTSKAVVMREAVQAGATMINDVRALAEPGALAVAAESEVPVCLMHMLGTPRTMQNAPRYNDVIEEVMTFLSQRKNACLQAGIKEENILIDPGFGFGKSFTHNMILLRNIHKFSRLAPVLVGLSRKSMIANILGSQTADRTVASVTAAVMCVQNGASIVRVHDVEPTVHALAVFSAVSDERSG